MRTGGWSNGCFKIILDIFTNYFLFIPLKAFERARASESKLYYKLRCNTSSSVSRRLLLLVHGLAVLAAFVYCLQKALLSVFLSFFLSFDKYVRTATRTGKKGGQKSLQQSLACTFATVSSC
jgi:hypothetical protein